MQISVVSSARNGVAEAEAKLDRTAQAIARDPADIVSLSQNAVALMEAKNSVAMNVKVLKAEDEMLRSAIDLGR